MTILFWLNAKEGSWKLQKQSDVISKFEIESILDEKGFNSITYLPLRSYIYPNYTGLSDEDLLEHFKSYYKGYLKTNQAKLDNESGDLRVLRDYYFQFDYTSNKKKKSGLWVFAENPVILKCEMINNRGAHKFVSEIGKYNDDGTPIVKSGDLYIFKVNEILKDNYKFYNEEDTIFCYNQPLYYYDNGTSGQDKNLNIGDEAIITMDGKVTIDIATFNGQLNFGLNSDIYNEIYKNPFATDFYTPIIDNMVINEDFYFDDLRQLLKSRKVNKKRFFLKDFNKEVENE